MAARRLLALAVAAASVGCRCGGALPGGETRAGDARTIAGLSLRWCPPGRFVMGSPPGEPGHRADEAQVDVTLTRGFWMAEHETTRAEWKRVTGSLPRLVAEAGASEDLPIVWVNFAECEAFCRQLTAAGRASGELDAAWEFRLPTEAQWEYACRAGTTTAFAFGDTLAPEQANFGKPYPQSVAGVCPRDLATPAGRFPPNAWGLLDLHGNEFEWCRDWYHTQLPGGIDPDLHDVIGTPNRDGTFSRSRRGGAWMDDAQGCRSAFRLRFEPERSYDHIGFRVVVVRTSP